MIWTIFQLANDRFLSAVNLTNLLLQIAAIGTDLGRASCSCCCSGEIDLSVGAVSGLRAAIMAVLNVKHGWAPVLGDRRRASPPASRSGCSRASWFTGFGVPSFVVTLAGLLAWQGALLYVLGDTGTINITDSTHHRPGEHVLLAPRCGWIVAALVIVAVRRRRALWHTGGASRGRARPVSAVVPIMRADRASWRPRSSPRSRS